MKKVITYGSFDLFHEGHRRLIQRAKSLGDYLIVGVTTEHYDETRGKINIRDPLMKRIDNIQKTGLVDEIIVESSSGQKLEDVQKYDIDIFTVGSDWIGVFDYLQEYCEVVYLERTKGISSSQLREDQQNIVRLGVISTGRIAKRFVPEAKYVSGVNVEAVFHPRLEAACEFAEEFQLKTYTDDLTVFFQEIDGVYIASPHNFHYEYAKKALLSGKHVLCEKPFVLKQEEAEELFALASQNNLVLMEAIKTAYCTGFHQVIALAKSGRIGKIVDVEACFTKLTEGQMRELDPQQQGGSFVELASYPLLPILKLLGTQYTDLNFTSFQDENGIDLFTKFQLHYPNAMATGKVGLGVKSDGHLLISGTKGYLLVEAPWWKTESIQICFENHLENEKFFYKFSGDGLRYELSEFVSMIINGDKSSFKLLRRETIAMSKIFEAFLQGQGKLILPYERGQG